ncbi:Uncharacterised protein [Stutzerimonas stutzeri]|nr:Uncharacterised protein [Stutzerimonas stutzeri]
MERVVLQWGQAPMPRMLMLLQLVMQQMQPPISPLPTASHPTLLESIPSLMVLKLLPPPKAPPPSVTGQLHPIRTHSPSAQKLTPPAYPPSLSVTPHKLTKMIPLRLVRTQLQTTQTVMRWAITPPHRLQALMQWGKALTQRLRRQTVLQSVRAHRFPTMVLMQWVGKPEH